MKRCETNKLTQPKVLIFCQDTRTCYQLKQYLTQSGEQYLLYVAMRHQIPIGKLSKRFEKIKNGHELEMSLSQKQDTVRKTQTCKKSLNKTDNQGKEESLPDTQAQPMDELTQLLSQDDLEDLQEGNFFQESYLLTMTQPLLTDADLDNMDTTYDDSEGAVGISLQDSIFEPFPEMENMDITATVAAGKQPLICLQTFKTERDGPLALERILNDIQPQYVIMYHCNVTAIRQLEIYEARRRRPPAERMKIFFLIHARTVEEQSYLTSLRREKQAFELIIDTKSVG